MEKLDFNKFIAMFENGSNNLSNNFQDINNLNVFPIPDGDTGTNMMLTMQNGINLLKNNKYDNFKNLTIDFAYFLLMNARGNSGIILSQLFNGLCNYLQKHITNNKKNIIPIDLMNAFVHGSISARKAVLKPVDGTILSVIKFAIQKTKSQIKKIKSFTKLFQCLLSNATIALNKTPDQLKILKESNVVDAGGKGFVLLLEGCLSYCKGKIIALKPSLNNNVTNEKQIKNFDVENENFGFCTECIIKLDNKYLSIFDKEKFTSFLTKKKCDSTIIIKSNDLIKLHTHTDIPGDVINFSQKFGELVKIKIENMSYQNENHLYVNSNDNKLIKPNSKLNNKKDIGIISVVNGKGIIELFLKLGVDYVIEKGQSDNPTIDEFLKAIEKVNAKNIIILPNNANIILTVEQLKKIRLNTKLHIIHSKTIMQGYVACIYLDKLAPINLIVSEMKKNIKKITDIQITKAVKNFKNEKISILKNNYIAIINNKIVNTNKNREKLIIEVLAKYVSDDHELITFFKSSTISNISENKLSKWISDNLAIEYEFYLGNQYIYDYLILIE